MNAPLRRGACPGLSAPMQTGDGLLVRLLPVGTIPLGAFAKLCAAARIFGNGIVEITARGSIQVRGLDVASAPRFAAAVAALGVTAQDGVPVHVNPLCGLDPDEIIDAGSLAADLRRELVRNDLAARLSPKVSVTVDGGGLLNLDALAADIRLRAELMDGAKLFRVSVGGDDANATDIGFVAPAHGVVAAIRLLEVIAQHGRDARAKDLIASEGTFSFSVPVADLLMPSHEPSCPASCRASTSYDAKGHDAMTTRCDVIGSHRLRDESFALGLGLAFGHADAKSLEHLTEAARSRGASGMRAAPGRALIVIGLTQDALAAFAAEAERLGFMVHSDDPRRNVFACAGAPICASAHVATRAMAPRIAADNAQRLRGSFTIHLSGCAKGCAHPRAATLTIVGTPDGCALIANGRTRDAPFAIVRQDRVSSAIAERVGKLTGEGAHV